MPNDVRTMYIPECNCELMFLVRFITNCHYPGILLKDSTALVLILIISSIIKYENYFENIMFSSKILKLVQKYYI